MSTNKQLCRGCRDDYYNQGSNSTTGECWLLKNARRVQRVRVGTWQRPPYRWVPEATNHCWHGEGQAMLPREDPRVVDDTNAAVQKWNEGVASE